MRSDLMGVTEHVWRSLCEPYDVMCEGTALEAFFSDVDLSDADRAAKDVLVNAILELMERIGRFSPWYTEPGSAFGLESRQGGGSSPLRCDLTADAEDRYRGLLDQLAAVIKTEGPTIDGPKVLVGEPQVKVTSLISGTYGAAMDGAPQDS